jgi:NDP-sugar pyrophosphorylase family protein
MREAVVLTAGLGTRLDPLTRLVAKPAVPVGDRALIEHVLAWLRSQGISDVVLNLHHRPETITGIVGDGTQLGLRVRYSWERTILGSGGGPRRALDLIEGDPVLIVNGDTICRIDLAPMLEAHMRTRAAVTMAVVPNPAPDHYKGIVLDRDSTISAFVPAGSRDTWHFVGVQLVNRDVLLQLADGVKAETTSELYPQLLTKGSRDLRGWRVDRPFTDVGTPRDYLDAALQATASPLRFRRSIVWPTAHIEPGADLYGCVVAGDVTLPAHFTARASVIVPTSVVRAGEIVPSVGNAAIFPL